MSAVLAGGAIYPALPSFAQASWRSIPKRWMAPVGAARSRGAVWNEARGLRISSRPSPDSRQANLIGAGHGFTGGRVDA
jgi:hypothetical protein